MQYLPGTYSFAYRIDMLKRASIAKRMSWAAKRQTSRSEDIAYCLLGIFGVSMPLLYGEGEKAFTRLQAEIIKNSGDHSFLACQYGVYLSTREYGDVDIPIFATSPKQFVNTSEVKELELKRDDDLVPFEMTNLGLRITVQMILDSEYNTALVFLRCKARGKRLCLPLVKTHVGRNGNQRLSTCRPVLVDKEFVQKSMLHQIYIQNTSPPTNGIKLIYIILSSFFDQEFTLTEIYPP